MHKDLSRAYGVLTKMAPAQAADLALIQQHSQPGAEIRAEEVLTFTAKLAHDQLDRSHERFSKAYLERFAETLPGKALLEGHDYTKAPLGRWFDAEVRSDGTGDSLYAKAYVKASSPIADDIRLGIAKDVSIGFRPDKLMCDMCGKAVWGPDSDCIHFPGQEYDGKTATATYGGDARKAEALEGSLVWLGCQPGAQVMGQSSPHYQRKMALAQAAAQGDDSMELKEALAEIERLKPFEQQAERHKKAAEQYEAFLRAEISRLTKAKELAATRDAAAADRAVAFVGKMSAGAGIEQLVEMRDDLLEQTKSLLAPHAKAEGAEHVPSTKEDEREPAKKVGFGPQRRALG